jgi:CheY-like chemotaxis protein
MSIALALLVSADPVTIGKFSHALEEYSLSPEVCPGLSASSRLLHRRKFDAVIVDLQLGEDCGRILDEVRVSPSNRTAVTFAIAGSDEDSTALFRSKTSFVFERPLSVHSILATLKPAYGLILRERRRYFRCPVSIPVSILRGNGMEVRGRTLNLSEGGMAVSTFIPLSAGEDVQVRFALPDHKEQFMAEAEICWLKTGHLGVRFVSLSPDRKSDLQEWLAAKLEEMLPELVARQFRKEQYLFHEPTHCLVR